MKRLFFFILLAGMPLSGLSQAGSQSADLHADLLSMHIEGNGFRFSFSYNGRQVVAAHAESGLLLGSDPVKSTQVRDCSAIRCTFLVTTTNRAKAEVTLQLEAHHASVKILPVERRGSVVLRTAGISPAYGLGDTTITRGRYDTDISGLIDDRLHAGPTRVRLMSNLVVFPKQGMAEVLVDPNLKILHLTETENAQGLPTTPDGVMVHYFFGTPNEVYSAFKEVRTQAGYPIDMPKYAMFGVGWEAFGALAWDTDETTVRNSVDRYLSLGFPLKWIVIGSGFWPEGASNAETTSFGLYNPKKYSHPKDLNDHLHSEGLKVLYGLRITFITDGPFAKEGVKHGYFLSENGNPVIFKPSWPESPCYLLDTQNSEAVKWYLSLVKKWTDYGVDGFKEDFFGYHRYDLRDDKLDPVNRALMAKGIYIIERNGYLGSSGDLHRIEDFNYDQNQDRGPVNLLALAYSGLPLGYPDIVGGTFGEGQFDLKPTPRMETYMMRNAQWASLHSSMSVGQPPWSFKNPEVGNVMLQAAKTHERLHPYIYSQAVRFAHDGFPWTMTPLPLAYPQDPSVYGRENDTVRGYEWMIGDALLAAPLYGDDYATANTRDIYLPAGNWMDYDTGRLYKGLQTLKDFAIPVQKTPLFIGGTGIVIEKSGDALVARAYPVTSQSKTEFWDADSTTHSEIVMQVKDWKKPIARDMTSGHVVEGHWVRFAYEFAFAPGHNYEIR
jgi:alpha-glucosidase (family GH31 glycosyl hydrolase)